MSAQISHPRARKSYADRTGMNSRASVILAAAVICKPVTFEDDDGNVIRVWKKEELSSYTSAQLAECLRNRVAIEANEMLGTVPMSGVKFCVSKGYLVARGSLYFVTLKAAIELNLPMRFKGGNLHGRKIPFAR